MCQPVRMQAAASMKLHHFARGFRDQHEPSPLTLACKRLRPLAPAPATASASASFDLKSFIRPESGPRKHGSSDYQKQESTQVEVPAGGTRWNPTQEQIGILEMLYRGGMRTPNAQQIEQITAQLAKHGKIEGKNVFYWFQNHKARERQKQKRSSLGLSPTPQPPPSPFTLLSPGEESDCSSQKRKLRSWCAEVDYRYCEKEGDGDGDGEGEGEGDRTLELFPLHPEGRS